MRLMTHIAGEHNRFAGCQRLFESINGINIPRRRTHQMNRPVKLQIGDGLLDVGDVNLRDWLPGLVLKNHAHLSVKGTPVGIDVDGRVY